MVDSTWKWSPLCVYMADMFAKWIKYIHSFELKHERVKLCKRHWSKWMCETRTIQTNPELWLFSISFQHFYVCRAYGLEKLCCHAGTMYTLHSICRLCMWLHRKTVCPTKPNQAQICTYIVQQQQQQKHPTTTTNDKVSSN